MRGNERDNQTVTMDFIVFTIPMRGNELTRTPLVTNGETTRRKPRGGSRVGVDRLYRLDRLHLVGGSKEIQMNKPRERKAQTMMSPDIFLDQTRKFKSDLPPRTSPPSKLDSEPFEVHSKG